MPTVVGVENLDVIASVLGKWVGRTGTIIIEYDGKKARLDYTERDLASIIEEESGGEFIVEELDGVKAFVEYDRHDSNYHARVMINAEALKDANGFTWGLFCILRNHRLDMTRLARDLSVVFGKYLGMAEMRLESHETFEWAWLTMIWGP